MKQYITKEQWDELDNEQKKYLMEKTNHPSFEVMKQFDPSVDDETDKKTYNEILSLQYKYFNIGQVIEFLDKMESYKWMGFDFKDSTADTFCDDLWEAVKANLTNNN